jgi:hypothetical protein
MSELRAEPYLIRCGAGRRRRTCGMELSALPPIDGNAWSAYIEGGRRHFDRVVRTRNVLVRNAMSR